MKPSQEDIQLGKMLKQQSYQAGDNPWFTKRVLNRLPESKRSTRWVWAVICIVAAAMCALCWWTMFQEQDFMVITMRDIAHAAVMLAVTGVVLWQGIATAFQRD